MICLDTSVLVDLLRGDDEVADRLDDLPETPATCFPVTSELYKGVYKSAAPEKGEREVGHLLRRLEPLPADRNAARRFGQLKQSYPDHSEFDLLIAAIVVAADASLLTRDSDFEFIDELAVDVV